VIPVIDVATSQRNLDFGLAFRSGFRACYVKLGGDNVGRYVAPNYVAQVDKARAAGFRVGHYWVPGATDPVAAADYAVDHLRGWTGGDFFVLDNETLDSGRLYEPADAARFLARVRDRLGTTPFIYVGASELRARNWAPVEALGTKLIVASYGANNGSYPGAPNLGGRFGGVWAGHQYTSVGTIGGVTIDLNQFQDWAFDGISGASFSTEEIDMGYTQWSQDDKDNLVKDIWQNFAYFKNFAGAYVAPIDMLRETERTSRTAVLGINNTENKVNAVVSGVGALAADEASTPKGIAAAIRSALPANLAAQVVAELGKQLAS